eukprot:402834-Prorocentrum_minimum.AAC.2
MLTQSPKRAHRYLFESGERHQLDSIRLSTGELTSDPAGIRAEVERVYGGRQQPVVDPEGAHQFPWDQGRQGGPLLRDSGGARLDAAKLYNEHIDCVARLPGRKAPGPDGVPNE